MAWLVLLISEFILDAMATPAGSSADELIRFPDASRAIAVSAPRWCEVIAAQAHKAPILVPMVNGINRLFLYLIKRHPKHIFRVGDWKQSLTDKAY
jgi:4-hydroxyphenylpyruvate dioxygenase-like putative hemolysin